VNWLALLFLASSGRRNQAIGRFGTWLIVAIYLTIIAVPIIWMVAIAAVLLGI
jgi:hypothetical protein